MSIRDYVKEKNTRNLNISYDTNDFSEIGYWLRSLKYRFKNKEIYNIRVNLNITYDVKDKEDIS